MPYISPQDRLVLNPCIERLKDKIVKMAESDPRGRDAVWGYLKMTALAIAGPCAVGTGLILNPEYDVSKIRDWMIAIIGGLFVHISIELKRAMGLPELTPIQEMGFKQLYQREAQAKLQNLSVSAKIELLDDVFKIGEEIITIAEKEPKNIAFVGLCNYLLTELGARLTIEMYGQDFNLELAQFLAFFWLKVKDDFYQEIAAPYADEKKLQNGNCPAFIKMKEAL